MKVPKLLRPFLFRDVTNRHCGYGPYHFLLLACRAVNHLKGVITSDVPVEPFANRFKDFNTCIDFNSNKPSFQVLMFDYHFFTCSLDSNS